MTRETCLQPCYRLFGARVEQIRTTLGLRQEDIAAKTGLTRASIANIEAGKQRVLLHHVEVFAEAFGMSAKSFLRGIYP